MRDPLAQAAPALDLLLRQKLGPLEGQLKATQIPGGQSNPTYFLDYDDRHLVLRKQPGGALLPSAHAIDREYRVMSALAGSAVPVPRVLFYHDAPNLLGTPFYVMERVEGDVFHDARLPGLTAARRRPMYLAMASTLAALHNVDVDAVQLRDFGRPGNYFARQMARWSKQWQLSRTREDATVERLIGWLSDHIPADEVSTLTHGDYRIGNLMFRPGGHEVAAVLDWELSTLGHPLADLAHCAIIWQTRQDEYGGIADVDLATLGIPDRDTFCAAYAGDARHGLKLEPFHLVFALFRWAVIFEGIAARANAGSASSGDAAKTGALAARFASRAAELI